MLLSAAPACPVTVAVVNERPGVEALASEVARLAVQSFEAAGAQAVFDPVFAARKCKGNRACIRAALDQLPQGCVLAALDIGKAGGTLAVNVQALRAADPLPLAAMNEAVPMETRASALKRPLDTLAAAVWSALRPSKPEALVAPPPAADAPRVRELTPAPTGPTVVNAVAPRPVAAIGTTVAAGATAVLAVSLGAWAAGQRSAFEASLSQSGAQTVSSLSPHEAQAMAARGNAAATGALVSGAAAVVLGGVATWLWLSGPGSD